MGSTPLRTSQATRTSEPAPRYDSAVGTDPNASEPLAPEDPEGIERDHARQYRAGLDRNVADMRTGHHPLGPTTPTSIECIVPETHLKVMLYIIENKRFTRHFAPV